MKYSDDCSTRAQLFSVISADWSHWLRIIFLGMYYGKTAYDKSVGDAFAAANVLYDKFNEKSEEKFLQLLTKCLIPAEDIESLMLPPLKEGRLLETFVYSTSTSNWNCVKCVKKEQKTKELIEAMSQPVTSNPNENKRASINLGSPENKRSSVSLTESKRASMVIPNSVIAASEKPFSSKLKADIGFLKRMVDVSRFAKCLT